MRKFPSIFILFSLLVITNFCPSALFAENQDPTIADSQVSSDNYEATLKKLIDESEENIKSLNEKVRQESVNKKHELSENRAKAYYEKAFN